MHPADIFSALRKLGHTQSSIAREFGVAQPSVGGVVNGHGRSARIERRISEITGLPLSQLWPQWYAPTAGHPEEMGVSLTGFRARLHSELDRLQLPDEAVAAIARTSVEIVQSWTKDGGAFPPVPVLIWLAQSTRLDLAYVMTGAR